MGAQRGDDEPKRCPSSPSGCSRKAGFDVVYPDSGSASCAAASRSRARGSSTAADRKSAELEAALRDASEDGRLPIVFDTSPCTYRMKRVLRRRLAVQDSIEFIHDRVLPRVDDRARCASRWRSIRCAACARWAPSTSSPRSPRAAAPRSSQVDDVLCCGFAGDKGFNRPELNEHALRHLKAALPPRLHARLLVEPHLRDRPVRAGGLSLPLDHPSRRRLRERRRRPRRRAGEAS